MLNFPKRSCRGDQLTMIFWRVSPMVPPVLSVLPSMNPHTNAQSTFVSLYQEWEIRRNAVSFVSLHRKAHKVNFLMTVNYLSVKLNFYVPLSKAFQIWRPCTDIEMSEARIVTKLAWSSRYWPALWWPLEGKLNELRDINYSSIFLSFLDEIMTFYSALIILRMTILGCVNPREWKKWLQKW